MSTLQSLKHGEIPSVDEDMAGDHLHVTGEGVSEEAVQRRGMDCHDARKQDPLLAFWSLRPHLEGLDVVRAEGVGCAMNRSP